MKKNSASLYKVYVILVRFQWKFNFSTDFQIQIRYEISSKSVRCESSFSMRTEGRRWKKRTISFRNFANALKMCLMLPISTLSSPNEVKRRNWLHKLGMGQLFLTRVTVLKNQMSRPKWNCISIQNRNIAAGMFSVADRKLCFVEWMLCNQLGGCTLYLEQAEITGWRLHYCLGHADLSRPSDL
jgi:hypothetical protein